MAVSHYSINILKKDDMFNKFLTPNELKILLQAWRNSHTTSNICTTCNTELTFLKNYIVHCNNMYFKPTQTYIVKSLMVFTNNKFQFLPEALKRALQKNRIESDQSFIVIPDPLYWQIASTLVFDRVMNFVLEIEPKKKPAVMIPKKPSYYYKQMQTAFLNHGSLAQRTEGKQTYFRKIALAKRCEFTARAMIIPAPFLKANEIVIPFAMDEELRLKNKWIILNRMPSLLPENFVALRVVQVWKNDCFGIPLEIAQQMNADFDGDECNAYIVKTLQAQAECETILNSECNISSFTMGLKLTPCHDMLITYYLKYHDINFLPYKHPNLQKTFKVIFDLYGSRACFEAFDKMRQYYLHVTQHEFLFTLTFREIVQLQKWAQDTSLEEFINKLNHASDNCLLTQVRSGAKGSFIHLYQLVGSVGLQYTEYTVPLASNFIQSSFLEGLTPMEMVIHAQAGCEALINTSEVWRPGYDFFKLSNNLQNVEVNHLGQVVDKDTIICDDSVNMLYYEDLMSKESFQELLHCYLKT